MRIDRRMTLEESDTRRALLGAEGHAQVSQWSGIAYGRGRVLGAGHPWMQGGSTGKSHEGPDGVPTTDSSDSGSYFDINESDRGELVRLEIVTALEAMGIGVASAHHEHGAGQHEIANVRPDRVSDGGSASHGRPVPVILAVINK